MARRFFRHGELPLVLLALVAERPRHGYELMGELGRLFGPRYRPSPGSIYPAIEALEEEGLIEPDGAQLNGKTVYTATESGSEALRTREEILATVELRTGVRFGDGGSLASLLSRFAARLGPLSGRVDVGAASTVLERAATEIEALAGNRSGGQDDR